MANENVCVFCGEKMGFFQTMTVTCAGYYLTCCKNCYKELKDLPEEERCRRALKLGLVEQPEKMEHFLGVAANAEAHRPTCLRCGTKLQFQTVEYLDNSPMRDSLFGDTFDVLPAYCEGCGRYEFFKPSFVEKDAYLARLLKLDTKESLLV